MKSFFAPTGRLIMSIGKDLIKDLPAALVELVKNSYDADADSVKITFKKEDNFMKIIVEDNGHGMSESIVLGAWMVPSTSYKLEKKVSPRGRIYQGRKGIGRYAASLLGNKLKLITIHDGFKTTAVFNWDEFETDKKLSEIPIEINSVSTNEKNGTKLIIKNERSNLFENEINADSVKNIENELAKLLSDESDFKISICYDNFFDDISKNVCKEIHPVKFDNVCHYRLSGIVKKNFDYELTYYNSYTEEEKVFEGSFKEDVNNDTVNCGDLHIDYKVYDKDPSGIELIMNFINSSNNIKLSKSEIKNRLIDQSGVSIFRNGFRIRPYGDKGFDWMNLDSKRVQNPSMSIGSEQINGRISIESEEISGLKEKSARDGLYENQNFFVLQRIAGLALSILEKERFKYRQQKPRNKVDVLEKLFDFSHVNKNMTKAIEKAYNNIKKSPKDTDKHFALLNEVVNKELENLEKEKESEFLQVKEAIAIYQKHTTLGHVVNVVLHESRKPLSWYTNKLPIMEYRLNKLLKNKILDHDNYDILLSDVEKLKSEAQRMSNFFKRLDPLSSNKRQRRKKINVKEEVLAVAEIFEGVAKNHNILFDFECENDIFVNVVEEDLYMALTNIVENAVFWVEHTKEDKKVIKFRVYCDSENAILEVIDNGPGISEEDIKDGLLFVPGYSRKNQVQEYNGTGLGLSIAGEAIQRNNGTLEVMDYSNGAYFRIALGKVMG